MEETIDDSIITEMDEKDVIKNTIVVANILLLNREQQISNEDQDSTLYLEVQTKLQATYNSYYERSGLKASIEALKGVEKADEEALQVISEIAGKGEGGWRATYPNLRTEGYGMDCTLAAAMLHLALDDLGYPDVYSTLRPGHYVITRILGDGSVKIYDPATTITQNGVRSGYSRTFQPNEVAVAEIDEGNGKKGKKISLELEEHDLPGGFYEVSSQGKYKLRLYAHPSDVYIDAIIALKNIDSLKNDAKANSQKKESETDTVIWQQQAKEIVAAHPEIAYFNYQQLKDKLAFFDPHTLLEQ